MRQLLEQSFLGLFQGSNTADYFTEMMKADLDKLKIGAVSSVTCIADYKQENETIQNKNFIQGLEKFIYSMAGKAFTAVCIANNVSHQELIETRKDYERIYTLMSPFANMQYNYVMNQSSSTSNSDTQGETKTESSGITKGTSTNNSESDARTYGTSSAHTTTYTKGNTVSVGSGKSHTVGTSDGISNSHTTTKTSGVSIGRSKNIGIDIGNGDIHFGKSTSINYSSSVSRSNTHSTSHTDSVSDAISQNLTWGINSSKAIGDTTGENQSLTETRSKGSGTQYSENEGHSQSTNYAYTKALTDTIGSSQAVTLNVQNKALINMLERLDKQLKRLDECESIGMWDFAAYFLGESAAEAETAASMYRSLVSGSQSGLELAAVNTWLAEEKVEAISRYVINFLHPVFKCKFTDGAAERQTYVDATALVSTNELALQLGLPRKSVKGLPVIEHALFAQEVLSDNQEDDEEDTIELGIVSHLGKNTNTRVNLNLESLSMHTFITGSTGSGKSNTVYQMLFELLKKNVHFLVIEPAKGEYKNIFGQLSNVSVYGTNPKKTSLLKINPFSFPDDIHILEHLDRLIEIFNACWPMYAAMPAILKEAFERAYVAVGWDLVSSENKNGRKFPNFADVLEQIEVVINESKYSADSKGDYAGALLTRVRSLTIGLNGLIFCSDDIANEDLFDKSVIVDLSRVGSTETKSLIMGLLVMRLNEYRMSFGKINSSLSHVTVLEEAHNLLKHTSTEQSSEGANLLGKSVEMLANSIAEMRTYGEGFIIADQSPGLLDRSVIRNTNTKIILRLPDLSDRELVGYAAGLNDEQIDELSKLRRGVAAVYQNDWVEPVLVQVNKCELNETTYDFSAALSGAKKSNIREQLVNLLIQGRVREKLDYSILDIEKGLGTLALSAVNAEFVEEQIAEYKENNFLELWSDENFRWLSRRLTDILGVRTKVENCVLTATDDDELTNMLRRIVLQISPEASKAKIIALSQCFMKDMSTQQDESEIRQKLYIKWVNHIKERGVR